MASTRLTGLSAITLGIGFNIPYAILAATYDYPQILRQPASVALERFAAGGPGLVLTWYGFMLAALLLVPLATALSITTERIQRWPVLTFGAALAGTLAGVTQAVGFARWVFVIPNLAASRGEAAYDAFDLLNAYGGVAIGEHLGQLLTALFVFCLAAIQRAEARPKLAAIGFASAATIALGTGEGVALALSADGSLFSLATIIGFIGLSVWLVSTGGSMLPASRQPALPVT
ncbi:DUF4386 family protein [Qipengyuania qiaonensis]|uniref:DUF4386 domain-containing protein n=1 Tax=Qipengyuania qiaonensis TaxID=2867240 RepID=A0ABS7J5T7_9SPHN|nr:DUF4386 family protein [Qipengyuania qiaonensis]MBX7481621.1 DUF4386 domain-containing protein [Qipengyuania qiaonensis]